MSSSSTTSEHSTATVTDVRGVIATKLDDSEIVSFLEDSWFDAQRAIDLADLPDTHVRQLEKYLSAYKIRSVRDRSLASGSRQSSSLEYEGNALSELRDKVRDLDPSGELIKQKGVSRRTAGNINSARPHSRDGIGDSGARER